MSMGMVNKDTAATIPAAGNTGDKVGNLAALHTTVKSDIVSAINEVKDEQANKADNDEVAPEFDNTVAYSAGNLVYHDGILYKFDSDHAAGAWDASEVSPTTVAAEFNQLKNTLTYTNYGAIDVLTVFSSTMCKVSNIAFMTIGNFVNLASGSTTLTGKIPVGYRPTKTLDFTLIQRTTGRIIAFIVYTNGDINLYNYGDAISVSTAFGDTLSWPIGS